LLFITTNTFPAVNTLDPLTSEKEHDKALVVVANQYEGEEDSVLGLLGEHYKISIMLIFNSIGFSKIRLQYDNLKPGLC